VAVEVIERLFIRVQGLLHALVDPRTSRSTRSPPIVPSRSVTAMVPWPRTVQGPWQPSRHPFEESVKGIRRLADTWGLSVCPDLAAGVVLGIEPRRQLMPVWGRPGHEPSL